MKKRAKVIREYRCSVCRKILPSLESGAAHLEKQHGSGYLITELRRADSRRA